MERIWQKRFTRKCDPEVLHFLSSIHDDERLIDHDIAASLAHVCMLKNQGMINARTHSRLIKTLKDLRMQYTQKELSLQEAYEDVHMNIEMQVKEIVGKTADHLHTARSRNDLIATDMRLYARQSVITLMDRIHDVQQALVKHGRKNPDAILPGYTHLRQAQPVLWSFYLLSIFFKFDRDTERLFDAFERMNVSPLGAGALAGTAHPIDPEYTASQLGFRCFADNSMDAVSARDFICEVTYCCGQIGMHIAAFAEDMVLYTTDEFAWIELDDAIATGSSIMPHKKNPDAFEILRARAATIITQITGLFSIIKGLPSSYNRDLQCTKKILFDCVDATVECLAIMPRLISNIHVTDTTWASTPTLCCATNLVDYLSSHTYTFRQAYHAVAACARQARGDIQAFTNLCSHRFSIKPETIERLLTPVNAVQAKRSQGSTNPAQVKKAMGNAQRILKKNKRRIIILHQACTTKL